ncbi:hypothetical protein [Halpernia sp. GG3]
MLFPIELEHLDDNTGTIHFKDENYQLLIAEAEAKILQDPINTVPTHHQHFNGSFAITTAYYEKSSGVPDVKFLEGCALFERLHNMDAKARKSNNVIIDTSARFVGRTQVGLSYQLNAWENFEKEDADIYVDSCSSIIDRFKIKKYLFNLWQNQRNLDLNFKEEINRINGSIIFHFAFQNNFCDDYVKS